MCPHCADGSGPLHAHWARISHLLALIEHPDALPADDALRIAGELLAWAGKEELGFRCEQVAAHAVGLAA
ncbi:hypothetical protein [Acidocella aromatica]|uniref:Uncharacterized protein n=1 Tax=Acidocella aromatica TaxID=1303579 RepID=A0A840VMK2_9PROT|nr:hypothetical protein [Acidocella aromatica]MBB5373409.1 hypothetical protein [Acidocella aromatica]